MPEQAVPIGQDPDVRDVIAWLPSVRSRQAERLVHSALDPAAATQRLNDLLRSAADATGALNAHVSMLTERQIVVGAQRNSQSPGPGLAVVGMEYPFEDTICALALRSDDSIRITNAPEDARVSSLTAVAAGAIGAYLGSPIRSNDGEVLGVLCVYDAEPREWTEQNLSQLDRLAGDVSDELHRLADATLD
jgi:GAF domain-containing protein